jgi:hypothetical protein
MKTILACAGTLAAFLGLLGSADGARGVHVYFLQGEQLVAVTRPGASTAGAVRQLLAGPRSAEAARGGAPTSRRARPYDDSASWAEWRRST